MTLGIMQPYFLPYIGYWQLLAAVDCFVVYDNIQYTKKGWINRNRFLRNGSDSYFTVPIKQASDYLNVDEREVAADFDRDKLLRSLEAAYRRAPHFGATFPVIERIIRNPTTNLFGYVYESIIAIAGVLGITTPLVVSSTVDIPEGVQSEQKVLAICRAMRAGKYVNPIGGRELYSGAAFSNAGIQLEFMQTRPIVYPQFGAEFVPNLSIVDVLMFNSTDAVRAMLDHYDAVPAL
jgi:hypothetical protein